MTRVRPSTRADQKALDPHRVLGFLLNSIALPFLIFLQAPLAWGGRWTGAFHPLNAFLVLGPLGWFSGQLWRRAGTTEMAPAVT